MLARGRGVRNAAMASDRKVRPLAYMEQLGPGGRYSTGASRFLNQ